MGSDGSSPVGKPSSSTSGGCGREEMSGSTPSVGSLRVRRMGGGAASSESESCSGLASEVWVVSSKGMLRECDLQKLKKLGH